ncbi:MAG TPA: hypothetical protein VMW24_09960 [Sedimentisphaerales bacterium]|nr:hypothetical protein [Sedimentisphaerales bacterium]
MHCIADWDENYEVDKDGRSWKEGKDFFAGALPYTRAPSRRDWPVRVLQIRELVGDDVHAIVGVFERLCGVVACEKRPRREGGIIRNSRGDPASVHDIARMLLWSDEKTEWALDILCHVDVEWVVLAQDPQDSADSSESRESSRVSRDSKVSASVKVITDQNSNKSCHNSNTERQPEIIAFLDLTSQEELDARPDIRCYQILSAKLKPQNADSYSALANFVQWLAQDEDQKRAGPDRYNQAIVLAKDCVHGEIPMAVFMNRVKEEWGYQPPSKKQRCR